MLDILDYKKENGNIDWPRYRAAQIREGEICSKCASHIITLYSRSPGPMECTSCKRFKTDKEEVTHDSLLRCPACGATLEANDYWESGIYSGEDLTHIYCGECEHEFEVTTHISYSYTSPPRIKEKI
jgi:DNA-directed RNA polymerase subunit M/transcription elongation factor TFIIS